MHSIRRAFNVMHNFSITSSHCASYMVLRRYRYTGLTIVYDQIRSGLEEDGAQHGGLFQNHPGRQYAVSHVDDAFSTIMQWLHARIPSTRVAKQRTFV